MLASTKRLKLRAFQVSNGERIVAFMNDRRVAKTSSPDYIASNNEAPMLRNSLSFIEGCLVYLVVEIKGGGCHKGHFFERRPIGQVCVFGIASKEKMRGFRMVR